MNCEQLKPGLQHPLPYSSHRKPSFNMPMLFMVVKYPLLCCGGVLSVFSALLESIISFRGSKDEGFEMPTDLPSYQVAWLLHGTHKCPRTMLLMERTITHMLQIRAWDTLPCHLLPKIHCNQASPCRQQGSPAHFVSADGIPEEGVVEEQQPAPWLGASWKESFVGLSG